MNRNLAEETVIYIVEQQQGIRLFDLISFLVRHCEKLFGQRLRNETVKNYVATLLERDELVKFSGKIYTKKWYIQMEKENIKIDEETNLDYFIDKENLR